MRLSSPKKKYQLHMNWLLIRKRIPFRGERYKAVGGEIVDLTEGHPA